MANGTDSIDKQAAKEILIKDFDYLANSFWKNEEAGETRVKFFITLVAAVIGLLAALTKEEGGWHDFSLPVIIFVLSSLLILGIVTFFRILRRNKVTDSYKKGMDEIRERFKTHFNSGHILNDYSPFEDSSKTTRRFGGLAHYIAAINSLLLSAIIGIILISPYMKIKDRPDILPFNYLFISLFSTFIIIVFTTSFLGQYICAENYE